MELSEAKRMVGEVFPKLDNAATEEIIRAVTRCEKLRIRKWWGDTYSILDDWTPEHFQRALASTVSLFNHNMKPTAPRRSR